MTLPTNPLEPLVLADGTKIDPVSGSIIREIVSSFIEVPSNAEAQALIVKSRRSVAELPLPPSQLNAVALVSFYTLFGLPDREISLAVDGRLTTEQIKSIKELDAYKEFMVAAKANIVETATAQVRDVFERHAKQAANKIVQLAVEGEGVLAFKASQDILDRAGHRPADIVEHRHRMEDNLNIVITRKDESVRPPTLDLSPDEVSYADIP